jgi:hypothetical protein
MPGGRIAGMNQDVRSRVLDLRDAGRSPKQIARALGIPPAEAAALVREIDAANQVNAGHPDIIGCWVSSGWSAGLTVDGHPEWRDRPADSSVGGLVAVLLARDDRRGGKVSVCGYLVDTYFLGVKNAVPPRSMTRPALARFHQEFFSSFPTAPLPAPLELAQHLVFGAIDYARTFGVEPHPDFAAAAAHLGTWTGTSAITFGLEGKPFYIQGPHDDPKAIAAALERSNQVSPTSSPG